MSEKQTTISSITGVFGEKYRGIVKLVGIIIIGLSIYFIWRKIYAEWKKNKDQKLLENSVKTTVIQPTGGGAPVTLSVNLGTLCGTIKEAFHGSWFSEDEDLAMETLANCPKNLIGELSALYFQLYGLNLKGDFQKYCSSEQWNKVSLLFN